MKVRLTFKTPDVLDYALEDIQDEDQRAEVEDICNQFIKYGEYLYVEIDTERETATVLKV